MLQRVFEKYEETLDDTTGVEYFASTREHAHEELTAFLVWYRTSEAKENGTQIKNPQPQ